MDCGRKVNRSELAEIFGLSLPTVDAMVRQGCPVVKRGRRGTEYGFNTAEVYEWRIQRILDDASGDLNRASLEEAQRRKMQANAELAELTLATRRKQLVTVDAVVEEVGLQLARVRAKLLSIPSHIGSQTKLPEAEKIAKKIISEALSEIVTDDASPPDPSGGKGKSKGKPAAGNKRKPKAAAKSKPRRVGR